MKTMTYTETRANFASVLDAVVDDSEEAVVTRSGHEPVVIVSLREWEAMKETAYLLRSPANARRIQRAIADLDAGRGVEHALIEAGDALEEPVLGEAA
ncbi:MAG: type II toxin-antitoxin system prevent-host-death family antitoxin [Propionibacteriaceae bacterium]|jgi:antitoxin YefM|nr:type II toxin-antitoxin system prevent-host-death family antitoxin [Propionibacteriaceae bacterium]